MYALILLASLSAPARAEVLPSLNVGAMGVVDTAGDGWLGEYVYVGPSLLVPISSKLAFIPSVTFGVAPELGNWGFVLTPTLEYAATGHIGIDLVPSFAQDTKGGVTSFVVSGGPGATYLFDSGVTLGVAVQASYVVGANLPVTVNPVAQIGVPLP